MKIAMTIYFRVLFVFHDVETKKYKHTNCKLFFRETGLKIIVVKSKSFCSVPIFCRYLPLNVERIPKYSDCVDFIVYQRLLYRKRVRVLDNQYTWIFPAAVSSCARISQYCSSSRLEIVRMEDSTHEINLVYILVSQFAVFIE